jgi:Nuclease-related domain.
MTSLYFGTGYAAVFLGVILFLLWLRDRSRLDRAPFPENMRLLRGPGESLRRRLIELDEKIENAILIGLVIPLLALGAALFLAGRVSGWTGPAVLVVGAVAFAVLIVVQARRVIAWIDRRRNTRLGLFGERIVAEHLEPLKISGHRVFHDVPAGDPPAGATAAPFNIDHVVVGPAGVFAIETKTRRKGRARVGFMAHEIIYDGRALAYPWGEDKHGLEQALRQAEWLAVFLERQLGRAVPVQPLLVFPGWMILRKGRGPVNVLNPKELPSAIACGGATPVLDAAMIDLVARQLESRCRDVEL